METDSYTYLAEFYDGLMAGCDYEKWSQYLYFLLEKFGANGGFGADAACGNGRLTALLHKKGLKLYGFDKSSAMLSLAAMQGIKGLQFIQADLIRFKSPKKLHFVNCSCDGYNYVPQASIQKAFANVYGNLKAGGVFLFDVSSKYKLENTVADNTFYQESDEVELVWNNTLDKEKGIVDMQVIMFTKAGALYKRTEERHRQYIHEEKTLARQLREAGFNQVYAYNFLSETDFDGSFERVQFAAVK